MLTLKRRRLNKNGKKSSAGLKQNIIKYAQGGVKTVSAPRSSIFNSTISSGGALTQKFINEMVIVFYVLDGKVFWLVSERVNLGRDTQYQV